MQQLTADNKLKNLIVVGDRVLIKPKKIQEKRIRVYIFHQVFKKRKKYNQVTL